MAMQTEYVDGILQRIQTTKQVIKFYISIILSELIQQHGKEEDSITEEAWKDK